MAFDFDLAKAKIVVKGVDIHLVFDDGAMIVMPGLGVELAAANAPKLYFGDEQVSAADFFARIGPVDVATEYSQETLQTTATVAKAGDADASSEAMAPSQSIPGSSSATSSARSSGAGNTEGSDAEGATARFYRIEAAPDMELQPSRQQLLPIPGSGGGSGDGEGQGNGTGNGQYTDPPFTGVALKDIGIRLYGYNASQVTERSDSLGETTRTTVTGFSGAGAAAPAPSGGLGPGANLSALRAPDTVYGSGIADAIYADDPAAGVGRIIANPRLSLSLTGNTASHGTLEITLPEGYVLVGDSGFTLKGSTWTRTVTDASNVLQFDLTLAYTAPTEATLKNADGFYGPSATDTNLSIATVVFRPLINGRTTGGYTGMFELGVRDVSSDGDLTFIHDKQPVLVLPATLGGNLIDAAGGDDTIVSGHAADTIDGGTGQDTVAYIMSSSGVSVSLRNGSAEAVVGTTGYARGDVIRNVENLVGSNYADTLSGNDGPNSLSGGGKDDTGNVKIIETGGGVDTLTIQASAGWTFNSSQNDSANRIEVINVQATNGAAMSVYGDGGDNAITLTNAGAVAGGHTLDGGTGSDTLKGSTGSDILVLDIGDLSFGVNAGKATASDSIAGGAGTDTGLLRASSATVLTATGAQLDAIFDTTEVLDFRGANVQVGQSGAVTSFTAADIQGIVGNGAASSLTIRFDAASSGASLHDFIGVMAGGGTTVTDGQGSAVTANTALAAGTYTFKSGATIVAQLVLQAS
ncbi:MAG: hypothetical protein U1E62_07155 [Alsobacter sp.]